MFQFVFALSLHSNFRFATSAHFPRKFFLGQQNSDFLVFYFVTLLIYRQNTTILTFHNGIFVRTLPSYTHTLFATMSHNPHSFSYPSYPFPEVNSTIVAISNDSSLTKYIQCTKCRLYRRVHEHFFKTLKPSLISTSIHNIFHLQYGLICENLNPPQHCFDIEQNRYKIIGVAHQPRSRSKLTDVLYRVFDTFQINQENPQLLTEHRILQQFTFNEEGKKMLAAYEHQQREHQKKQQQRVTELHEQHHNNNNNYNTQTQNSKAKQNQTISSSHLPLNTACLNTACNKSEIPHFFCPFCYDDKSLIHHEALRHLQTYLRSVGVNISKEDTTLEHTIRTLFNHEVDVNFDSQISNCITTKQKVLYEMLKTHKRYCVKFNFKNTIEWISCVECKRKRIKTIDVAHRHDFINEFQIKQIAQFHDDKFLHMPLSAMSSKFKSKFQQNHKQVQQIVDQQFRCSMLTDIPTHLQQQQQHTSQNSILKYKEACHQYIMNKKFGDNTLIIDLILSNLNTYERDPTCQYHFFQTTSNFNFNLNKILSDAKTENKNLILVICNRSTFPVLSPHAPHAPHSSHTLSSSDSFGASDLFGASCSTSVMSAPNQSSKLYEILKGNIEASEKFREQVALYQRTLQQQMWKFECTQSVVEGRKRKLSSIFPLCNHTGVLANTCLVIYNNGKAFLYGSNIQAHDVLINLQIPVQYQTVPATTPKDAACDEHVLNLGIVYHWFTSKTLASSTTVIDLQQIESKINTCVIEYYFSFIIHFHKTSFLVWYMCILFLIELEHPQQLLMRWLIAATQQFQNTSAYCEMLSNLKSNLQNNLRTLYAAEKSKNKINISKFDTYHIIAEYWIKLLIFKKKSCKRILLYCKHILVDEYHLESEFALILKYAINKYGSKSVQRWLQSS